MYIKWIVCDVIERQRENFSIAQNEWYKTKKAGGFIAQAGGWDSKNKNKACIISFWKNKESLDFFMKNTHDIIFNKNEQVNTYSAITVSYFKSKLVMYGKTGLLTDAIKLAKFLRIADCEIKSKKIEHFEKVQKTIWFTGMKKSKGMLNGVFSQKSDNKCRYLVSSFWDGINNHKNYVKNKLPKYKVEADIKNDIIKMTGKQVLLVDSWKIIK